MTAARRRARRAEAPSVTGGRRKTPRGREQSVSRPSQRPPSDAAAPRDPRTRRLAGRRLRPGPCGRGSGDACCHAPSGRSSSPSRRGGVSARPASSPAGSVRARCARSPSRRVRWTAISGPATPRVNDDRPTHRPHIYLIGEEERKGGQGGRADGAVDQALAQRIHLLAMAGIWRSQRELLGDAEATSRSPSAANASALRSAPSTDP